MVNPQVSLLNWTLEADIPGDVMWSLIDGKHIVSVTHQDGLFVNRVDDGLDEEIDGMAADFAMRLKEDNEGSETVIRICAKGFNTTYVTRIRIQHVMMIRILHVKRIDLVQRRTRVKENGGADVDIILSRPKCDF